MTTTTTDRMHVLQISWSVSRGRDTYGYNICRLDDGTTRYRCMGGGYDMTGTVVAEWLQTTYRERLEGIADRAYYKYDDGGPVKVDPNGLYGMYRYSDRRTVTVDGACGLDSVERIGKAIGLHFRHVMNRRGQLTGIIVTDNATVSAS